MKAWKLRVAGKVAIQRLLGPRPSWISDSAFVRLQYLITFGRLPNLHSPKTFNEHICARKIAPVAQELALFTDKYSVRDHVEKTIGLEYLVRLLGVYNVVEQIPWRELPDQFVVKCSHGSSFNVIVRDKALLKEAAAAKELRRWLAQDYYEVGRERNYASIQPRIMVEEYLGSELDELKLFCFRGRVGFIQHNREVARVRHSNLYNSSWQLLRVQYGYSGFEGTVRPEVRQEVSDIAESLALRHDFVRVDLYLVEGRRIFFGELTFNPGGGLIPFDPREADDVFGCLFEQDSDGKFDEWLLR